MTFNSNFIPIAFFISGGISLSSKLNVVGFLSLNELLYCQNRRKSIVGKQIDCATYKLLWRLESTNRLLRVQQLCWYVITYNPLNSKHTRMPA